MIKMKAEMDKKVGILTLGCRVNQYESEAIAEELEKRGFTICNFDSDCDIYIINSCSVTAESDRKSRQMIGRAVRRKNKKPDTIVIAAGCFVQGLEKPEEFVGADLLIGTAGKNTIPDRICELLESRAEVNRVEVNKLSGVKYEETPLSRSHIARAFVKIEDGCNSFCSYCFVPYVRGRVRSREPDEIISEINRLTANGFFEIVLTGIETSCYGEDLGSFGLIELVERIHSETAVHRIRFGSLKPTLFTEEFTSRLSKLERVEKHFHLSIQSGSSEVLSAMRRNYTKKDIIKVFSLIYKYFPDACLSADIICGFPGESEQDFSDSIDIVRTGKLLHAHVFPYSERRGTLAAKLPGRIPPEIRKKRVSVLSGIADRVSLEKRNEFIGCKLEILIEKIKDGKTYGHTENLIYTSVPASSGDKVGDFKKIVLE